ncbi:MAG: endonuclease III [Desulfuromonas sp.]|nr:MAG: endonuclease III [Desulfuromonas sp.]
MLDRLEQTYPDAHCALHYKTPWQLLAATILSAQCTDVRVNQVTPALFARYPRPSDLAVADPTQVEGLIRSTGFYRNKAKSLIGCADQIVTLHGGEVPSAMDALVALPGVGRKTANVVLGNAFSVPGMVVDTHIGRVTRRLGWTRAEDAVRVEKDLCRLLPDSRWTLASHLLIAHGRNCCRSRTAICSVCPVSDFCPKIGVRRHR